MFEMKGGNSEHSQSNCTKKCFIIVIRKIVKSSCNSTIAHILYLLTTNHTSYIADGRLKMSPLP